MAIRIAVLMFMAGLAASIGQIIVIRELLVIFYGNELSAGLVLACWLLCTAAGSGATGCICKKRPPGFKDLVTAFAIFCAALPATIVWIRTARALWSIPPGELLSPAMMLVIAITATAPVCILSGLIFALAWELARSGDGGEGRPISVYLAESLGAGGGGLVFYFILLPLYSSFAGSLALVFVLLACAITITAGLKFPGRLLSSLILIAAILGAGFLYTYSNRVELTTRRLEWGKNFLDSRDTPYHNLVVLSDSGQSSLFSNGLWLFTTPDPQSIEPAAHLPLLQHADPKQVLVIGDYSPDLPTEILKNPTVTAVDCLQPDEGLTAFTRAVLPSSSAGGGSDSRVQILHMDPKRYMGVAKGYDVVLLSAGEPVNAEMNRFYTVEFFSRIKSMMNPGGLFSFGVPSAPDIIGPRQALLLRSLNKTLREVFGSVLLLAGESARFIVSRDGAGITKDPQVLIGRMRARNLDLKYVRDFYLFDVFNPVRLAYMDSVIGEGGTAKINKDFEPVCYLYGLGLWGAQLHPAVARLLGLMSGEIPSKVLAGLVVFFIIFLLFLRVKSGFGVVVALNTGVCGCVLIILEVALVLIYQIMEGSVYRQLALIISLFMTGLAAGSALGGKEKGGGSLLDDKRRRLFMIQIGLASYMGALYLLLTVFRGALIDSMGHLAVLMLFLALAFLAGMFGGAQFAAAISAGDAVRGAGLYAADLVGAALGAVVGSLFLLPVLGIPKTLLILGFGCLATSMTLLKKGTGGRI